MKSLSRCMLGGMLALSSFAMQGTPAKPGHFNVTQPDGSVLTLTRLGDERCHITVTPDGLAVGRCHGAFHYLEADGSFSDVTAHNPAERTEAELAFVEAHRSALSADAHWKARASVPARSGTAAPAAAAPKRVGEVSSLRSPKIPVLLVAYSDYPFKDPDPKAVFTDFYEKGEKSARQYFIDQSCSQYTPDFDVYGPVTIGKRVNYGGNDIYGEDKGVGKMVAEACIGLDSEIDFSRYDNDGDGRCDVVIVLYAGDGEASSYQPDAEDAVWPCQWNLRSSDYGKNLTQDGVTISAFAVFNELNGEDLSKIDGVGTFCHEFSHCLGLPDFYDTVYGGHFGMGPWSVMDSGCYNDDTYTPVGYSAYEKNFMGWIDIPEAGEHTHWSLPPMEGGKPETQKAIRLTNPADPDEYYILENRARSGWDAYMDAEGMLITHVTYSASAWANNTPNNYDPQRMTLIPADGSLKQNKTVYQGTTYYQVDKADLKGDLWPWGNATELTDSSTPRAEVNKGSGMGKPITEITRTPEGNVEFWVMKGALPPVALPHTLRHMPLSDSAVTFTWLPGDESDATFTLELRPHEEADRSLVGTYDFTKEGYDGWTSADNGYLELINGLLKFGSTKKNGALASPLFTLGEDGLATIRLVAEQYSSTENECKVMLIEGNMVFGQNVITLGENLEEHFLTFRHTPGATVKLQVGTTGARKRFYATEASIYLGDRSVPAAPARVTETLQGSTRQFSLIDGHSHTVEDLQAGSDYDWRLKAVATDAENFGDSPWTDWVTFSLPSGSSAVALMETDAHPAEYYNLQGMRQSLPLAPGIYILRQGARTAKVAVK